MKYKGYSEGSCIDAGKWKGAKVYRIYPKLKSIILTNDDETFQVLYFHEFDDQVVNCPCEKHGEPECEECGWSIEAAEREAGWSTTP